MSKHAIQVTSIYCNSPSESSTDELYLICQSDGGLPLRVPAGLNTTQEMEKGDTWTLSNLVLYFEYEVLVTLWDHDMPYDPNTATYLQSIDFQPGNGDGYRRLKNRNGADYTNNFNYIS